MKKYLYYLYWLIRTWPLRWHFPKYKVLSAVETVHDIITKRKNLSRFGDGEFYLLLRERGIGFQDYSEKIADRLNEVLNSELENLLVTLPLPLVSASNLKRNSRVYWLLFRNTYGEKIKLNIKNRNTIFGNTQVSRFYMDYNEKGHVPQLIKKLREIWNDQDVLIIEGEFSRLGIGNDFFNNCKSIERILCPSKNAFEKYEEILSASQKYGTNKLIILALGPSATILSYDLAKENYWALDLGHIDIEYSWFLENAQTKIPVKGKKSAEVSGNENFDLTETETKAYRESIVAKIL